MNEENIFLNFISGLDKVFNLVPTKMRNQG